MIRCECFGFVFSQGFVCSRYLVMVCGINEQLRLVGIVVQIECLKFNNFFFIFCEWDKKLNIRSRYLVLIFGCVYFYRFRCISFRGFFTIIIEIFIIISRSTRSVLVFMSFFGFLLCLFYSFYWDLWLEFLVSACTFVCYNQYFRVL